MVDLLLTTIFYFNPTLDGVPSSSTFETHSAVVKTPTFSLDERYDEICYKIPLKTQIFIFNQHMLEFANYCTSRGDLIPE